jgi:hypothetical protein
MISMIVLPRLRLALSAGLFWLCLVALAGAEPRIALVVGNSGYQAVSSLENPSNDAKLIGQTLSTLGFDVTLLTDASLSDFREGVARFGQALRAAGPEATGLFYYAGHGVQSFGTNYLLPVDASLTDAADLDLVAVEAQSVLRQMSSARNRTNIVILDACRNNPFAAVPDFGDNGLAEMKAPTGTFLAYATAPGSVALDGLDGNSPFTAALSRNMVEPALPIEQMFKKVRVEVLQATGGLQTPWDTSSLTADFQFRAGKPVSDEDALWISVAASRDPVQIMLFLRAYPEGEHFEEARALLAEVMDFETGKAGTPEQAQPPETVPDPDHAAPKPPDAAEQADFESAQAAASEESWAGFLERHPDSVFREIAESELAAMREKAGKDPDANPPGGAAPPLTLDLFFDQPLTGAGSNVEGKSIATLITGSPLFPPFEGIPEHLWKGQTCSNCHHWDQPALCDQGKFYVRTEADDGLGAIHPYGGEFRRVLKAWAAQGCR